MGVDFTSIHYALLTLTLPLSRSLPSSPFPLFPDLRALDRFIILRLVFPLSDTLIWPQHEL